jgi:hypothetical protein
MCGQCLSNAEAVAGGIALAVAVFRDPVHTRLADAGLVAPIDLVGRNARTVTFLRSLDLDPVDILGAGVVEAADRWVRPERRRYAPWRSFLPIGSQRRLAAQ